MTDTPLPESAEIESTTTSEDPTVVERPERKVLLSGEKRTHAHHVEDDHIPSGIKRDDLSTIVANLFSEFYEEQLYDTKHFLKHFSDRRALVEIPVPSLLDHIKHTVCYDAEDQFDLRLLIMTVVPQDRKLLIDLCKQVSERFVNNPNRPKSPLTLMQFKVILAYRMAQLGF